MQRMSRGTDQWQLNAHRLDSLDYVTTRSNGQEGFHSRTRSSTRVNLEIIFFSFKWEFLKKLQMSIFQHFLDQNMFTPKKSSKDNFSKTYKFTERAFFWEAFLFGKLKKKERHQKNRIEKEEIQKNTNTKILKDNWKIGKSFLEKEWSKIKRR